ncbi:acetate/propionate family kinase [Wenxinia saemankumensis]|uniref:Acetate kinase n=1 Tax=Wenxinia saemankumensis TaxID=1447782 RepID=A0A1M6E572_9RHOB|nr:acetate kinase [Wenxinia saemankumensis]SHI80647.1 acetate kinase [Wenxinia saemankumensis]
MILVLNAGSSSLKADLFDAALAPVAGARVGEIGGAARLTLAGETRPVAAPDHAAALDLVLGALSEAGHPPEALEAAAHRVVHGGPDFAAPVLLDDAAIARIEALVPLAPLHNPVNLAGIRAMARLRPDLPQTASFDTAFHAAMPELSRRYALPEGEGHLRRYGFHGLSYAGLVHALEPDLPERLVAFHLGGGASLCAIRDGRSVATSMGYSPLSGLVMGTRPGEIDGMAVLDLARRHGIDGAARLLNRESGLTGLAGTGDMRALLARDDAEARFAVALFVERAAREGAGAIVAMGGVDALAFTGGIGENAAGLREAIAARLAPFGTLPIHVVAADEAGQIARDARAVLRGAARSAPA